MGFARYYMLEIKGLREQDGSIRAIMETETKKSASGIIGASLVITIFLPLNFQGYRSF